MLNRFYGVSKLAATVPVSEVIDGCESAKNYWMT
jgi:hypothetical protein